MDEQIKAELDALAKKVDATYQSAEKTRRYILIMMIATLVGFVLPLVGLIVIIPWFLQTITAAYAL